MQDDADYPDADLIIASDGMNSRIRTRYAASFRPDIVTCARAASSGWARKKF